MRRSIRLKCQLEETPNSKHIHHDFNHHRDRVALSAANPRPARGSSPHDGWSEADRNQVPTGSRMAARNHARATRARQLTHAAVLWPSRGLPNFLQFGVTRKIGITWTREGPETCGPRDLWATRPKGHGREPDRLPASKSQFAPLRKTSRPEPTTPLQGRASHPYSVDVLSGSLRVVRPTLVLRFTLPQEAALRPQTGNTTRKPNVPPANPHHRPADSQERRGIHTPPRPRPSRKRVHTPGSQRTRSYNANDEDAPFFPTSPSTHHCHATNGRQRTAFGTRNHTGPDPKPKRTTTRELPNNPSMTGPVAQGAHQGLAEPRQTRDPTHSRSERRDSRHAGTNWRGLSHQSRHSQPALPRYPARTYRPAWKILTILIGRVNCISPAFLLQTLKNSHSLASFPGRPSHDSFIAPHAIGIEWSVWPALTNGKGVVDQRPTTPFAKPQARATPPQSSPAFATRRFFHGNEAFPGVSRERAATNTRFTGYDHVDSLIPAVRGNHRRPSIPSADTNPQGTRPGLLQNSSTTSREPSLTGPPRRFRPRQSRT
jgi:hypothetical protein